MKKLFPIILLAVVAFCSCDDNVHYLSKSEKPIFHEGDTFYYYSEQAHLTDTFVVDYLHYNFEPCDEEEYEGVSYWYIKTNIPNKESFRFCYRNSLMAGKKFYYCDSDCSKTSYSPIHQGLIEIGGRNYYYDIVCAEETNVEPLPDTIFISYTHGIIGYTYPDSTKYIITNPVK